MFIFEYGDVYGDLVIICMIFDNIGRRLVDFVYFKF